MSRPGRVALRRALLAVEAARTRRDLQSAASDAVQAITAAGAALGAARLLGSLLRRLF